MSVYSLISAGKYFNDTLGFNTRRKAGFSVDLSGELAAARDMLALPAQAVKAQQRALGTLARRLPVEARRDIQSEYRLKASRVRKGLRMRATRRDIRLVGSARGINVAAFGATWSRRSRIGARYAVRQDQAKVQHEGEFIGTGRGGNRLVFERSGRNRLPLVPVYAASIGQMLKHGQRPDRLADYAGGLIRSEINRQLDARATP